MRIRPNQPAEADVSLSPRDAARAIGVSESSLKRWCDRGLLTVTRTVGGHRRIAASEVMRFARDRGDELAHPDILGLPKTARRMGGDLSRAAESVLRALTSGDDEGFRGTLFGVYLGGTQVADIFDVLLAPAFHAIGDQWECGDVEVYEERRGSEMTMRFLYELRRMLPAPDDTAPVAIGSTLEGDTYSIPLTMAELVLRDAGWRASSLGPNNPAGTLAAAIESYSPTLVFLSASTIHDRESFVQRYGVVWDAAQQASSAMVLGGRALVPELRRQLRYTSFCESMSNLRDLIPSLR